jgi:hypothetical protein
MKSTTTHISETVVINKPYLTVTFSEEDIEAILLIGMTSSNSRKKFFEQQFSRYPETLNETVNNHLADMLGELYFAAADFKKDTSK